MPLPRPKPAALMGKKLVVTIPDDVAEATFALVGGHAAGWFCGQPLFDWIAEVEPGAFGSTSPIE